MYQGSRGLMAISLLPLLGCSLPLPLDGIACTASVEPAIVVEIRDALTNAPLAADARGVVRDGAFVDSLTPYAYESADPKSLVSRRAADEREGVYAVEIQRTGYATWSSGNLAVGRDECHVETKRVVAFLQRNG
jgi:hypothetical protein